MSAAHRTVLVVDDLESVRFYHELLLTQCGYETLSARDGAEALVLLEQKPVDLVMLDLLMPNMSGTEFMRRARLIARYAALPVLIISSEGHSSATGELKAQQACEVLQKPILPDALVAAVKRLAP